MVLYGVDGCRNNAWVLAERDPDTALPAVVRDRYAEWVLDGVEYPCE